MERKARDSCDSVKDAQRGLAFLPLGLLPAWAVTLALLVGAVLVARSWHTVAAIGLTLAAVGVQVSRWNRLMGPCAAVVAGVVVTRFLFLEDSKGRTRAWLGVENEYGDEEGPRLVLYDAKGQARLALRLVEERHERDLDGPDAEVVPTGQDAEESELTEPTEPALVMFNEDGKINLSLWSCGDCPALEAIGAAGHAGVQPGNIWALPRDGKLWSAPPDPAKDLFEE